MSRSYRIDMFAETGFNAVDIPYSPQLLYDEFEVFKRYQDLPIVQDEWEANIKVDDLTPEEVRKIDYVIIVDEADETKMTCYTVKNYKFLSDDVVQINLLLDPYNTMGGFIKGSNNNVVVSGSAKRLTVPLNYKAGVYEQADNKDFFVLNEPFSPATRLLMTYDNFNFDVLVPSQPKTGDVGVVRQYIELQRPESDKYLVNYINMLGFNDNSIYFDSQSNTGLNQAEYEALMNNPYVMILADQQPTTEQKVKAWCGNYYGYASAYNNYWYLLSYDDRNNPKNIAEFMVQKNVIENRSIPVLTSKLVMTLIGGTPPTAQTVPANEIVKAQWQSLYTRALQLWEAKVRDNWDNYGGLPEYSGQRVHVCFIQENSTDGGRLQLNGGVLDLSQIKFAVFSKLEGSGIIPTTETVEYYTM